MNKLSATKKIGQCYFCNSDNKYGVTTYLSIGTFCSIKLKPFWLSELLVILDNKFKATKTKDINFSNQIQNYLLTSYSLVVTSVVAILTIWIYQSLLTTSSQIQKRMARVIFVILANKYGITYLPQLPPGIGSLLSIDIKAFWLLVGLDNKQLALRSLPKRRKFWKSSLVKGLQCLSNRSQQLFVT